MTRISQETATPAMFILFLSVGHVMGAVITCEPGRSEGDKWFDGCRWCVCQSHGPGQIPVSTCTSSTCQQDDTLQPCKNIGSKWRDGCYNCECHPGGIDCRVSSVCMTLLKNARSEGKSSHLFSAGGCSDLSDPRCVCGLDGVPSCTAEALDQSVTEAEINSAVSDDSVDDLSLGYLLAELSQDLDQVGYRMGGRSGENDRRRSRRKNSKGRRRKSGDSRKSRRKNKNRSSSRKNKNRNGSRRNKNRDYPTLSLTEGGEIVKALQQSGYEIKQSGGESPKDQMQRDASLTDVTGKPSFPPSILVTADNRCRYGTRWYAGDLRCYCDRDGSVTCGEPSFVAPRIDGFRAESVHCEEGEIVEDQCQMCECQADRFMLCKRLDSQLCPLPFVFKPVDSSEEETSGFDSEEISLEEDDEKESTTNENDIPFRESSVESEEINRVVPADTAEENIGSGDVESQSDTTRGTMVQVVECTPNDRWMDGCLRCECDSRGRKYCDDRNCLKAPTPPPKPTLIQVPMDENLTSDPSGPAFLKLPEEWSSGRTGPVQPAYEEPVETCGRFKVGEQYWSDSGCNMCKCTTSGPICHAVGC